MKPFKEYEVISTFLVNNYTLWTTELIDGSPVSWRGGETVPPYDEKATPPPRHYDVKVNFSRADVNDSVLVNALLSWNTTGGKRFFLGLIKVCLNSDPNVCGFPQRFSQATFSSVFQKPITYFDK